MPKQQVLCQICRLPLNSVSPVPPDDPTYRAADVTWVHPLAFPVQDHEPVPVEMPYQDAVSKCDFCSGSEVVWVYPCRSFRVEFVAEVEVVAGHGSEGDWAACQVCYVLIEAGQWDRLAQRSFDSYEHSVRSIGKNEVKRLIARFHRQFRLNRTGAPFRLFE